MSSPEIHAAGAVLWRPAGAGCEVALVHRPKYDDWTIPKGKIGRREHTLRAARREVYEETGVKPVLGRRLAASHYDKDGRAKRVDYWAATAEPGRPVAEPVESEVDKVEWLPLDAAAERLSYERDRSVLRSFAAGPRHTVPLILLRHANTAAGVDPADADGTLRPLDQTGRIQAQSLAKLLACFGTATALAASTVRSTATLTPYANRTGIDVVTETALNARLDALLADPEPTILCGDLDTVTGLLVGACERLGHDLPRRPRLPPAGFWVLHLDGDRISVVEEHRTRIYGE